jgi:hypothetical protein
VCVAEKMSNPTQIITNKSGIIGVALACICGCVLIQAKESIVRWGQVLWARSRSRIGQSLWVLLCRWLRWIILRWVVQSRLRHVGVGNLRCSSVCAGRVWRVYFQRWCSVPLHSLRSWWRPQGWRCRILCNKPKPFPPKYQFRQCLLIKFLVTSKMMALNRMLLT